MTNILLVILIMVNIILLAVIIIKSSKSEDSKLNQKINSFQGNLDRLEKSMKDEMYRSREEASTNSRHGREEVGLNFKELGETITSSMTKIALMQKNQLDTFSNKLDSLTKSNEIKLDNMRKTVEEKLEILQKDNNLKLEQMRTTVDEKLHNTLEKRLGESFKIVSERLELVHKGLGEMQTLASGVGDLKKVLTNIKTRGTWGEVQLGNLLEQILTKDQFGVNVATKKGSSERVEFAVKLPSKLDSNDTLWLPIDSKFPVEDYIRLQEAQDNGSPELIEEYSKQLELRIKSEAKDIKEKYIDPPHTTDFGLLFLPIEGLYAEILRRPGVSEFLQREYKVILTGPTTLAALLNSLQMGFRTLAIEKRSSEVWQLLGAVKHEFGRFGVILDKTQKKLQEASNSIETAAKKSRNIERKLSKVQELPDYSSSGYIELKDNEDIFETEEDGSDNS